MPLRNAARIGIALLTLSTLACATVSRIAEGELTVLADKAGRPSATADERKAPASAEPSSESSTVRSPDSTGPLIQPPVEQLAIITKDNVQDLAPWHRLGRGTPMSARWSPRGEVIAVASTAGVSVYDGTTFSEIWSGDSELDPRGFEWNADFATGVTFDPTGELVATWGSSTEVRVWHADDGKLIGEIEVPDGQVPIVTSAAFSADGFLLATADMNGNVCIWKVTDGELLRVIAEEGFVATQVAFIQGGSLLVAGLGKDPLQIRDVSDGSRLRSLGADEAEWLSVTASPNGEHMAGLSGDGQFVLWNLGSGEVIGTIHPEPGNSILTTSQLAFSADSRLLALAARDKVQVWSIQPLDLLREYEGHADNVTSASFSPDGQKLVSTGLDRSIRIWDLQNTTSQSVIQVPAQMVTYAFSPDGSMLATGSVDSTVTLWDVASGRPRLVLDEGEGPPYPITGVAFGPDGATLASGDYQEARLWHVPSGQTLLSLNEDYVSVFAFSPDGRLLATSHQPSLADAVVQLWDTASGDLVANIIGHQGAVWQIVFSLDGRYVVSGGSDGAVRLWQAPDGSPVAVLAGHSDDVNDIEFSPDGHTFASASSDGTIRIWDLDRLETVMKLESLGRELTSAAYGRDGTVLVSTDLEGEAILWEVESGARLRVLPAFVGTKVETNPSGSLLAFMGIDGTVWLWGTVDG